MASLIIWIFFAIYLAVCVGFIVLQVYLSKMKSRWPGLILPIASLLFSLIAILGITLFSFMKTESYTTYDQDGVVISEYEESIVDDEDSIGIIGSADGPTSIYVSQSQGVSGALIGSLIAFLSLNIPTGIYLLIYFICRLNIKKKDKSELDKMTIQDL